jgi:hypothetical protein
MTLTTNSTSRCTWQVSRIFKKTPQCDSETPLTRVFCRHRIRLFKAEPVTGKGLTGMEQLGSRLVHAAATPWCNLRQPQIDCLLAAGSWSDRHTTQQHKQSQNCKVDDQNDRPETALTIGSCSSSPVALTSDDDCQENRIVAGLAGVIEAKRPTRN